MISLDLLASFASAARHSSFAGAARELGHSPSAIAKNIARLEAQLGLRLFHRTTRRVTLSLDGEQLYAKCTRILEDVESLEAAAAGMQASPGGTLRIDLPVTYGRQVMLPVLTRLLERHPELQLDARFSDQTADVVKEGLDAAVRIGPLPDSRLVGQVFDQQRIRTYASPAYLEQHGTPPSPADLVKHVCLIFRLPSSGRDRAWQFRRNRREFSLLPDGQVRLGDGEALAKAASAGMGLIQVPDYMVRDEVMSGALVEVLENYRPASLPISLVYPSHRYIPLRVRALADALAARTD